MHRYLECLGVLMLCAALPGCGKVEEKAYPVSGTVSLDGKALDDGEIYFVRAEKGDLQTVPIKGGSFSGKVKAGKQRVQINAFRATKPQGAASGMTGGIYDQPGRENYIPAKYNVESTLTADVSASGPNQLKFDLTSGDSAAPPAQEKK